MRIPDVSQRRALKAEKVAWSEAAGRITLKRPKFGRVGTRILRMFRLPPDFTIHLDPLGSAAWGLMDGRQVKDILADLQAKFPEETDLGPRLGKFLGLLVSRGMAKLE